MAAIVVYVCTNGEGVSIPNGRNTSGLSADNRLVPHCPSGGEWRAIEVIPDGGPSFELIGVDAETTLAAMLFGFGFVAAMWGIGWAIGAAMRVVKEA